MKRTHRSSPLLLILLALGIDSVLSFSVTSCFKDCCLHPLWVPKNPLVELHGKNNDDDSKIDWNPKSRPKIAEKASYSDNWLLNFHLWDQSEKQLVTNSLTVWNEVIRDQQATIIEWQDSFQRNDLADFTPPMSNGLNCLMVGDDFDVVDGNDGNRRVKLPWEEEPEAQVTSLRVLEESVVDMDSVGKIAEENDGGVPINGTIKNSENDDDGEIIITVNSNDGNNEDEGLSVSGVLEEGAIVPEGLMCGTNGKMVRTQLVSPASTTVTESSSAIRSQDAKKQAAVYDCIIDQGLMGRILALENSHETVRELLEEAAVAIKDLGIYVLVTKELTVESRRILEDYGLQAGLEWQFELDGISDETQVVSVARRFCTGEMPKVGRLSRYQPEMLW